MIGFGLYLLVGLVAAGLVRGPLVRWVLSTTGPEGITNVDYFGVGMVLIGVTFLWPLAFVYGVFWLVGRLLMRRPS